jgi:hypothetical protein
MTNLEGMYLVMKVHHFPRDLRWLNLYYQLHRDSRGRCRMARPSAIGGTNPFGRFIVAVLAFAMWTCGAAAGQLTLTAVNRDAFADAFNVMNPTKPFMESSFSLKNGETAGVMRSEEGKSVAWHPDARSLERHGIPREFTTQSRVIYSSR